MLEPVMRIHEICYGSGSADPYLWLMDPDTDADPDPAIFVTDLQDINKIAYYLTFWSYIYIIFQR